LVFGRVPQEELLSYVSNYDIALYPRRADHGMFQTTKVVEYMGCGVPTVAYDTRSRHTSARPEPAFLPRRRASSSRPS
jgi:glycosyltransferase involved in cell wall biosynthesis